MSDNTYWGNVPRHAHILEPGEYEDNNGTKNDRPAIWMGECLVEGSREAWKHFAQELLKELGETITPSDVIITADEGKVRTGAFTPLDAHEVLEGYKADGYALEDLQWEVRA